MRHASHVERFRRRLGRWSSGNVWRLRQSTTHHDSVHTDRCWYALRLALRYLRNLALRYLRNLGRRPEELLSLFNSAFQLPGVQSRPEARPRVVQRDPPESKAAKAARENHPERDCGEERAEHRADDTRPLQESRIVFLHADERAVDHCYPEHDEDTVVGE